MRLSATIAGVLAAALIGVGCGGGSDDDSGNAGGSTSEATTASSLSKAEFIEAADAVCTKGGKQAQSDLAAYTKENKIQDGKLTTPQVEDVAKDILIPALERQVGEIRALGVPEQDQLQIIAFLEEVEDAVKAAKKDPQTAVQSPDQLLKEADKVVEDYGFKVCAQ